MDGTTPSSEEHPTYSLKVQQLELVWVPILLNLRPPVLVRDLCDRGPGVAEADRERSWCRSIRDAFLPAVPASTGQSRRTLQRVERDQHSGAVEVEAIILR